MATILPGSNFYRRFDEISTCGRGFSRTEEDCGTRCPFIRTISSIKTPLISIICFAVAAVVGALGQYLYKSGSERTTKAISSYLNLRLLGGVVCYVAVMVLFVAAFKRGGSLTVLYPIYASTFIWAAVIAYFAYSTPIRMVNVY